MMLHKSLLKQCKNSQIDKQNHRNNHAQWQRLYKQRYEIYVQDDASRSTMKFVRQNQLRFTKQQLLQNSSRYSYDANIKVNCKHFQYFGFVLILIRKFLFSHRVINCVRVCAQFTTCNYEVDISLTIAIFISSLVVLLMFLLSFFLPCLLSTKCDRN